MSFVSKKFMCRILFTCYPFLILKMITYNIKTIFDINEFLFPQRQSQFIFLTKVGILNKILATHWELMFITILSTIAMIWNNPRRWRWDDRRVDREAVVYILTYAHLVYIYSGIIYIYTKCEIMSYRITCLRKWRHQSWITIGSRFCKRKCQEMEGGEQEEEVWRSIGVKVLV